MPKYTIEDAARAAHEANRCFCIANGDYSQPTWEEAPEWVKQSAISGVEAVIDNLDITPEELHEKWLEYKKEDGWVYGDTKDPEAKTHPSMVPYSELPIEERLKDALFRQTVEFYAQFIPTK